jgi:GT2 family glycosyltransferase
MDDDKVFGLEQKIRRLESEQRQFLNELGQLRSSPVGRLSNAYRAWLERERQNGSRLFHAYDRFTSAILQRLAPPSPPVVSPFGSGAALAKRFEGLASAPAEWRLLFEKLDAHRSAGEAAAPRMSILTPAWNTRPHWFTEAAVSVLDQTCPDWEWILVDDASVKQEYRAYAEALAAVCPRFRFEILPRNQGIAGATNAALALARGEYVCMFDHDDLLHPEAVAACLDALDDGNLDAVYTDSDKVSEAGLRDEPFYKPDWSPEYFRGVMYVGHLLCVRRELARASGGFDGKYNGIQDFEFFLRVSETARKIGHIPRILYHWRRAEGSIASALDAKDNIGPLQQAAVNAHLKRLGLPAEAKPGAYPHRVAVTPLPRQGEGPLVSIVIPTRDAPEVLTKCLDSIRDKTAYKNYQVVCADNESADPQAIRRMREPGIDRVVCSGPFHYSRINNEAIRRAAKGEYLVLLNNDIEVITPGWLEEMLYYAEQPDVGAVGAALLYPNGTVQHAGVALGFRGTADHLARGFDPASDGYAGSLSCAREVSAVTAACLMVKRSLFDELGGLNEHYVTAYQDVDFCLRLIHLKGKRNIFTPRARLYHHESYSRKSYYDLVDRGLLLECWDDRIPRDPYFNPNFSREHVDYRVAPGADTGDTTAIEELYVSRIEVSSNSARAGLSIER